MSVEVKVKDFKAHYGSSPLVIADIWHDLCHTSIKEAHLEEKGKSEKGFKRFMRPFSSLVVSKEHQPHDDSIQNLQALSGRQRVVVLAHEDWSFEGQEDGLVF
jgi:hypothetical protein